MRAQGKAPATEPASNDIAMAELFGTDSDEDAPAGVPSQHAPAAKTGDASSSAGGTAAASSSRGNPPVGRRKEVERGEMVAGTLKRAPSQRRQPKSRISEDVRRALAAQVSEKLSESYVMVLVDY